MTDDNKKEERTLFQYCRDQHLGHLTSIFLDNLVSGLLLGNLMICFCKLLPADLLLHTVPVPVLRK